MTRLGDGMGELLDYVVDDSLKWSSRPLYLYNFEHFPRIGDNYRSSPGCINTSMALPVVRVDALPYLER